MEFGITQFSGMILSLRRKYGEVPAPPAKGPFELVIWENACYLLPDARREAIFEALQERVGLHPRAILDASDEISMP